MTRHQLAVWKLLTDRYLWEGLVRALNPKQSEWLSFLSGGLEELKLWAFPNDTLPPPGGAVLCATKTRMLCREHTHWNEWSNNTWVVLKHQYQCGEQVTWPPGGSHTQTGGGGRVGRGSGRGARNVWTLRWATASVSTHHQHSMTGHHKQPHPEHMATPRSHDWCVHVTVLLCPKSGGCIFFANYVTFGTTSLDSMAPSNLNLNQTQHIPKCIAARLRWCFVWDGERLMMLLGFLSS